MTLNGKSERNFMVTHTCRPPTGHLPAERRCTAGRKTSEIRKTQRPLGVNSLAVRVLPQCGFFFLLEAHMLPPALGMHKLLRSARGVPRYKAAARALALWVD